MSLLFLVDYQHRSLSLSSFLKGSAVVYTVQNLCTNESASVSHWYFPPLYLKFHFWIKHKQCESHPCIHLQISRVEPPPRVPLPLLAGGDRCLAGVRPLRQQQQLCPRRTHVPHWCLSTMPATSSQDTGTRTSPDSPMLTSQTDLPVRRGPEITSNFFFMKEKLLQETGESRIRRNTP